MTEKIGFRRVQSINLKLGMFITLLEILGSTLERHSIHFLALKSKIIFKIIQPPILVRSMACFSVVALLVEKKTS